MSDFIVHFHRFNFEEISFNKKLKFESKTVGLSHGSDKHVNILTKCVPIFSFVFLFEAVNTCFLPVSRKLSAVS